MRVTRSSLRWGIQHSRHQEVQAFALMAATGSVGFRRRLTSADRGNFVLFLNLAYILAHKNHNLEGGMDGGGSTSHSIVRNESIRI